MDDRVYDQLTQQVVTSTLFLTDRSLSQVACIPLSWGRWLCMSGGKSGDGEHGAMLVREFQELACNQFQATSVAEQEFLAQVLV